MTEDAEFAKLSAYFKLLSDANKQEVLKRAEYLAAVQKKPEEETKGKTNNRVKI